MLSPLPRFNPTKTQSVMFQKKHACPGLATITPTFKRLRANLTPNQSGSTWQDQGDKMAPRSNQLGLH
jgi:hypothetical protein